MRKGEIALTFTVASLILMVVGSALGLGVNKSQDTRSKAAPGAVCGKSCQSNADCGRDSESGSLTTCDFSSTPKRCKAVRDPKNPPCNVIGGEGTLGMCNDECKKAEDCNASDATTGISLTCDMRTRTCQQRFVNDARYCPGFISPTPRTSNPGGGGTGGGGGSPAPTSGAFRSQTLSCGVGFRVVVDPVIDKITLISSSGGGQYTLGTADLTVPSTATRRTPIGYRMWKLDPSDLSNNLTIEWNPSTQYPGSTAPKGAFHVQVKSGSSSNPNSKIDPQIDFYYFNNIPRWLKSGEPVTISFSYYVTSGPLNSPIRTDHTIQARSNACPGTTTVTPPTTTSTPPPPSRCNEGCETNAQCPTINVNGVQTKLVCLADSRGIKLCQNSKFPGRLDCMPPPTTPTVITRTPTPSTPTRTPTPTLPVQTPTPVPCETTIDFMIDASKTTQEKLKPYQQDITDAVRAYGNDPAHKNDKITFYTSYFAKTVRTHSGGPFTAKTFSFPIQFGLNWTNIKAALETIGNLVGSGNGKAIFISDGLPSVIDNGAGEKGFCVYGQGDLMDARSNLRADGCGPNEQTGAIGIRDAAQCSRECSQSYAQAYDRSLITTYQNDIYGVFVDTGVYSDENFVSQVSQEVIPVSQLTAKIGEIFDKACNRSQAPSQSRGQIHSLMSSFTLNNESTEKSIDSVIVKACTQDGADCQEYENPVQIAPGTVGHFTQAIPADVPAQNRALLTCDVYYSDSSSLPCPSQTAGDDGIKFDLVSNDEEITGSTQTFLQAADLNNDGTVNGVDYTLFIQCKNQADGTDKRACDIIADDVINAQDVSVVVERLGQLAQ